MAKKRKLPKQRMHHMLFAANTPFKPKRVENKKAYKRKLKNARQED